MNPKATKRIICSISSVVATVLLLSACSSGSYSWSLNDSSTPVGCLSAEEMAGLKIEFQTLTTGDTPILVDDDSPQFDEDFTIKISKPVGTGFEPLTRAEIDTLYVAHIAGLRGDVADMIGGGGYPTDTALLGWGLPNPTTSPTSTPVPSPSYSSRALPSAYPTTEAEGQVSAMAQITTDQIMDLSGDLVESNIQEKIDLSLDVLVEAANYDNSLNAYNILRFMTPGAITVRCVNDSPEVIRAFAPIYVNYIDNIGEISFDPNVDPMTGTMQFSTAAGDIGFEDGVVFSALMPKAGFESELDVSLVKQVSWYLSILNMVAGYADKIFIDGETDPFFVYGKMDNGVVHYDLSGIDTSSDTEYLVFCQFIKSSTMDLADVLAGDESVNLMKIKTGVFTLKVGAGGIESVDPEVMAATPKPSKRDPVVTVLAPNPVSRAGGEVVTMQGTRLENIESISIEGKNAPIISATHNEASFRAPALDAGRHGITATLKNGKIRTLEYLTAEDKPKADEALKFQLFKKDTKQRRADFDLAFTRLSVSATGYTNAKCVPLTTSLYDSGALALAQKRAVATCAALSASNPELKVKVSTKPQLVSKPKNQVAVKLHYK